MLHDTIEQKLNEILELLKPTVAQSEVEEWEDVTAEVIPHIKHRLWIHKMDAFLSVDIMPMNISGEFRIRKIDGLHNGPAFIVERKRS